MFFVNLDMEDIRLFHEKLLCFGPEWRVELVKMDDHRKRVDIHIIYEPNDGPCSETGEVCKVHDYRDEREWRHLDSMCYATYIHCRLPRVKNSFGQVKTMGINWAEPGASHTVHFENRCIDTLQSTHNRLRASRLINTSDDMVCGIMHSSVYRGLARRDLDKNPVLDLCIDEKSIGKGQKYVSVLSDGQTGAAIEIAEGRDSDSVEALIDKTFTIKQLGQIERVCCDMWGPFMDNLKKNARMRCWSTTSSMWSVT
jgi:transposase